MRMCTYIHTCPHRTRLHGYIAVAIEVLIYPVSRKVEANDIFLDIFPLGLFFAFVDQLPSYHFTKFLWFPREIFPLFILHDYRSAVSGEHTSSLTINQNKGRNSTYIVKFAQLSLWNTEVLSLGEVLDMWNGECSFVKLPYLLIPLSVRKGQPWHPRKILLEASLIFIWAHKHNFKVTSIWCFLESLVPFN